MIINASQTTVQSGGGGLPAEYQEVEYIESTGTQYINTGYVPNKFTSVFLDFEIATKPSSSSVYHSFFGTDVSGNVNDYFAVSYNNSTAQCRQAFGSSADYYSFTADLIHSWLNFGSGNAGIGTSTVSYYMNKNGVGTVPNNYVNSLNLPLYLFAINSSNTAIQNASFKFFYCKIVDNYSRTVVRNFVPCYRKADGVIGMYDTVNGVFYTNAGTGTFLKGADV